MITSPNEERAQAALQERELYAPHRVALARFLREIRKQAHLTQGQIAEAMDLKPLAITAMETAEVFPISPQSYKQFFEICRKVNPALELRRSEFDSLYNSALRAKGEEREALRIAIIQGKIGVSAKLFRETAAAKREVIRGDYPCRADLGDFLRELRGNDMTQTHVARTLGRTSSWLSQIERGIFPLAAGSVREIFDFYRPSGHSEREVLEMKFIQLLNAAMEEAERGSAGMKTGNDVRGAMVDYLGSLSQVSVSPVHHAARMATREMYGYLSEQAHALLVTFQLGDVQQRAVAVGQRAIIDDGEDVVFRLFSSTHPTTVLGIRRVGEAMQSVVTQALQEDGADRETAVAIARAMVRWDNNEVRVDRNMLRVESVRDAIVRQGAEIVQDALERVPGQAEGTVLEPVMAAGRVIQQVMKGNMALPRREGTTEIPTDRQFEYYNAVARVNADATIAVMRTSNRDVIPDR